MRKLSKREKRGIALAVGVTFVAVVFYVVVPFFQERPDMGSAIELKQKQLQRAVTALQQEESYRLYLQTVENRLRAYDQELFVAKDAGSANGRLEEVVRDLAARNDVRITRSSPLPERKMGETYTRISLSLNLESDIPQLVNFLYALSAYEKFLLVEDLKLNSFRSKNRTRIQPQLKVSGLIRLS